jgi:DNA polymerase III delta subunit
MKLIILHGEDVVASRQAFNREKEIFAGEKLVFEGRDLGPSILVQAFEASSLFVEDKALFIENLIGEAEPEVHKIIRDRLDQEGPQIVVWEKKKLTSKQRNSFPGAQLREFKLPQIIFKYLESLRPGNRREALSLLQQALGQNKSHYIFQMLIWHFRHLLIVGGNNWKEHFNLPGWRVGKLKKQLSFFSKARLIELYESLLKLDVAQKRGGFPSLEQGLTNFTIQATRPS